MDRKIRPSGLTTFAIFNFVFAGLSFLGLLFTIGAMSCVKTMNGQEAMAMTQEVVTARIVFSVVNAGLAGLLITAGIGYLKLGRIAGRWCGNLYAILAAAKTVVWLALGAGIQAEFTLGTVSEIVWPLLTLFFINVVFRDVWKKRATLVENVKDRSRGEPLADAAPPARQNRPHLFLVMMQSVRQTLRGVQGILFIWIALVACFAVAGALLLPYELAMKANERQYGMDKATTHLAIKEGVKQAAYGFFVWLFDEPPPEKAPGATEDGPARPPEKSRWAEFVTQEKPAYLSFIFAILMALFPVLCAFLVFNQISGDAQRKGFRYLLLRTSRASIYFGKLLASIAIIIPVIILSVSAIAGYIHFKLGYYAVEDIVSWSLWGVVMLTLVSIPSIAFCLAVSGLINFGFGSLAASALSLGLFPVFTRLLKDAAQPFVAGQFLLPLKTAYFLFHPEWWVMLSAAAGCLLYAAAFSAAGFVHFRRKSL